MSERFAQQDEWPGPPVTLHTEPKCGVWNTITILLAAVSIGVVVGLIAWKVWG